LSAVEGDVPHFERLLPLLLAEEQTLNALLDAAARLGNALIASDHEGTLRISDELTNLAAGMDRIERDRTAVVASLGFDAGAALSEIAEAAFVHGNVAVDAVRERLLARATELQAIQERNAALVISAVRLRDRWVNLLAGMMTGTYGSGGRAEMHQDRRIVSRSA
jgi:hypothetical protein